MQHATRWIGGSARRWAWALGLILGMGAAACGDEGPSDAAVDEAVVVDWSETGEVFLSALVGETVTESLVFGNGGNMALDFEVSLESGWLAITPPQGSVAPGAEQELTLAATCPEEAGNETAGVALLTNASQRTHSVVVHLNCTEPAEMPEGAMRVTVTGLPEGVAGDIKVVGPGFESTVTETTTLEELAPGDYSLTASEVTFGPATYRVTPRNAVVSVQNEVMASVEFEYQLELAELDVWITGLPEGVDADVTVTGPDEFETRLAESATLPNLLPGNYEVTVGLVTDGDDRYTASSTSVLVSSHDAASVDVSYELVLSSLHVAIAGLPQGVEADVTVTNDAGFSEHLTATDTLHDLVPGEYVIHVGAVTAGAAHYTGANVAASLNSGESATVAVDYVAWGRLEIMILGFPADLDAAVVVSNEDGFEQTITASTTLDLVPGDYSVMASNVVDTAGNVLTTTFSEAVVVSLENVASVLVEYDDPTLVTSDADDGPGSLRVVIDNVNPGSRIHFDPGLAAIILTSGEVVLSKDVVISGPGASELEISGNQESHIFNIDPGVEVTIRGITLTNGSAFYQSGAISTRGILHLNGCAFLNNNAGHRGGAITQEGGTLFIANCEFSENNAGNGGAIYVTSEVFVSTSTFINNVAGSGGAIFTFRSNGHAIIERSLFVANHARSRGGAIESGGPLTVTNSTFTLNSSEGRGGAIYNMDNHDVYIGLSVIGNTAREGGGIITYGDAITSTTIGQSIIAQNTATASGPDVYTLQSVTPFISRGYNIIGQDTDALGWADGENNDLVGSADAPIDPEVEELADNGGSSETMALADTSPAYSAIPEDACLDADELPLLVDQRGSARPQDGYCSIGAF